MPIGKVDGSLSQAQDRRIHPAPLFYVGNNLNTHSNSNERDKEANNKAYQQSLSNIFLFKNKKQYCSKQQQQHITCLEHKQHSTKSRISKLQNYRCSKHHGRY